MNRASGAHIEVVFIGNELGVGVSSVGGCGTGVVRCTVEQVDD